jgi:hypothetical protein
LVPLYDVQSSRAYNSVDFDKFYLNYTYAIEELDIVREIEKKYGLSSGLEFLALSIMFVV